MDNMPLRHALIGTVLGSVTIVADGNDITGLYFDAYVRRPAGTALGPRAALDGDSLLREAADQLDAYLNGRRTDFDLPLKADGSPFERSVWELVTGIPLGRTTTYAAIAERLGSRTLARRVGQAIGRNPLCIFIPFHRVIGSDGSLTGYSGGVGRKRALLELEGPLLVLAGAHG